MNDQTLILPRNTMAFFQTTEELLQFFQEILINPFKFLKDNSPIYFGSSAKISDLAKDAIKDRNLKISYTSIENITYTINAKSIKSTL